MRVANNNGRHALAIGRILDHGRVNPGVGESRPSQLHKRTPAPHRRPSAALLLCLYTRSSFESRAALDEVLMLRTTTSSEREHKHYARC